MQSFDIQLFSFFTCGVGRTVNFTLTVDVNPAATVNSFTACEINGGTVTATPVPAGTYNYAWTVPAGFTNPGNVASFSTSKAGTYIVVVTNTASGCSSISASGNVTITPAIQPVFIQVDTICKGTVAASLPVRSVNGITGVWSPAINNQVTTTYVFTPDPVVCANTAAMTIVVNDIPEVNLGGNRDICKGETVLLDPKAKGTGLQYLWQDGSTASVFAATQPGNYSVTVTNSCGAVTQNANLTEVACKIFIPSAFTPNEDGLNDRFQIIGAAYVKDFSMKIYNRWGKVIYETNNPYNGWNGTVAGLQQPAGLFIYDIRFINTQTGEENVQKGNVLLVR